VGTVGALIVAAGSANAGVVVIGGGWQASWDSSLDPFVDINPNGVSGDGTTVFFEKTAQFTQGPVNGIFPSIPIVFSIVPGYTGQIANKLVIDDEIITNSTGVAWTDFHIDVLNHGEVAFDPVATANSGGTGPIGWTVAPFQQAAFSDGNTRLDIWDGVIPSGTSWFPGSGASDGQLWINVNNVSANTLFILKETPTPAPGAIALLGLAGLLGSRRRRH
jgi:MYXO-CTERM domain-containing protein